MNYSHGNFQYRLPAMRQGTIEPVGYSIWHLMAARMMPLEGAIAFLEEASQQRSDLLLDDIRESMTIFPHSCRGLWLKHACYRKGWTWPRVREFSAWKNPIEICVLIGLPLVPLPSGHWMIKELHPVITAAHESSCRQLGLFIEDWWS
jgi:hypothetical protein